MVKKQPPAYFACPYEVADASALQALERGEATPDQQQRALQWIIHVACATYQPTFHPGEPDASAFAEGRRYPGLQAVKLLKLNTNALTKAKDRSNG